MVFPVRNLQRLFPTYNIGLAATGLFLWAILMLDGLSWKERESRDSCLAVQRNDPGSGDEPCGFSSGGRVLFECELPDWTVTEPGFSIF